MPKNENKTNIKHENEKYCLCLGRHCADSLRHTAPDRQICHGLCTGRLACSLHSCAHLPRRQDEHRRLRSVDTGRRRHQQGSHLRSHRLGVGTGRRNGGRARRQLADRPADAQEPRQPVHRRGRHAHVLDRPPGLPAGSADALGRRGLLQPAPAHLRLRTDRHRHNRQRHHRRLRKRRELVVHEGTPAIRLARRAAVAGARRTRTTARI